MATLLLVVIYLSFISLGVPDSLLGTAWPVLYRELGVPLASQSAVSILCSLATMTSSMNSARIISHLGTGKVTAFSTLFDRRRPARLLLFGQLLVHVPDGDSAWAGRGLR